jgi:single-stranded-DNA-specific exonuclease
MKRKWMIRPHDSAAIRAIEYCAGVSPVVAQLLAVRGMHDAAAIRRFIEAPLQDLRPPAELPGADAAAKRILDGIARNERIVIYGDYDADGMTASAILIRCLRLLGGNVHSFVPNRIDDGYGLNDDAIARLAREGANLIVTVDCGIASVSQALTAKQLGVDLVITDHHQFGSSLPEAVALVHPGLPGSQYPFAGLCGAGVALKLAWRICQLASGNERVQPAHRRFLLVALGLAAIGTVSDVVPLVDENRLIVRHGLMFMRQETVLGLRELFSQCGLLEKPVFDAEDIAFTIGPRLNAAGRLGQAELGVELMTTDSTTRASALAEYVNQLNTSRESIERKIQKSAFRMISEQRLDEDPAIVLADRDWHVGIIGIVAGRIAEKFRRPVVLISRDESGLGLATGSGRTAAGVDLYEALAHCAAHLETWGGHRAAAGLRIRDENIDGFREAFIQCIAESTRPADFERPLEIDMEVPLAHLSLGTVEELEKLAPFGMGNSRPVFCSTGVRLAEAPTRMGNGERHLALKLRQHNVELRCVAFGGGEWADQLDHENGVFDFAFRPVINRHRGYARVELQLVDWRQSGIPVAAGSPT